MCDAVSPSPLNAPFLVCLCLCSLCPLCSLALQTSVSLSACLGRRRCVRAHSCFARAEFVPPRTAVLVFVCTLPFCTGPANTGCPDRDEASAAGVDGWLQSDRGHLFIQHLPLAASRTEWMAPSFTKPGLLTTVEARSSHVHSPSASACHRVFTLNWGPVWPTCRPPRIRVELRLLLLAKRHTADAPPTVWNDVITPLGAVVAVTFALQARSAHNRSGASDANTDWPPHRARARSGTDNEDGKRRRRRRSNICLPRAGGVQQTAAARSDAGFLALFPHLYAETEQLAAAEGDPDFSRAASKCTSW
jgi:hypothetical protein